jgi:hypothetical protein
MSAADSSICIAALDGWHGFLGQVSIGIPLPCELRIASQMHATRHLANAVGLMSTGDPPWPSPCAMHHAPGMQQAAWHHHWHAAVTDQRCTTGHDLHMVCSVPCSFKQYHRVPAVTSTAHHHTAQHKMTKCNASLVRVKPLLQSICNKRVTARMPQAHD